VRRILLPVLLLAALSSAAAAAPPAPRTTKAPWPRPDEALALTRAAGLQPKRHEFFQYHVHSHLDILVDRRPVRVPSGIGIDIADPGVGRGRLRDGSMAFGGIRECLNPCISPLHTHDDTGIIHTESQRTHPNRLGQFFVEWRVRLTKTCIGAYCRNVRFYLDGKRFRGDPRRIGLVDRLEIAIVVGKPPRSIPSQFP
jgi:hypothetical protein